MKKLFNIYCLLNFCLFVLFTLLEVIFSSVNFLFKFDAFNLFVLLVRILVKHVFWQYNYLQCMNSYICGRNTQDTNYRNNSVTFQGGQNLGACASGFGTCCLISVSQCDGVITENSTVTVVFINTNSIYFDDRKKST